MKTIWIAGEHTGQSWEVIGAFEKKAQAEAACHHHRCFVGPLIMGKAITGQCVPWEGAYYPHARKRIEAFLKEEERRVLEGGGE